MTLPFHFQIHSHPQRDLCFVWRSQWAICTLDDSSDIKRSGRAFAYVETTEMKAVFSIVIKGTISTISWDAMSSNSGGVTETRRETGRAISAIM